MARHSDGSSDEETRDSDSEVEGGLETKLEKQDKTAKSDDLLILKKRHVDCEPGPLPDEVTC